jgi:uncharacterized protein (TIGR02118 family)
MLHGSIAQGRCIAQSPLHCRSRAPARQLLRFRAPEVCHRFRSLSAMKCITVFYPSKDNDTFDHEFYRTRHAPLIENILGKSLHRIEVRRGLPAPDGTPPLYTAVISIWIADWDAYEKAMAVRAQELIDEVPLFTKVMPSFQTDEVYYTNPGP